MGIYKEPLKSICTKILPRNLRAGLIVLLFCATLTVVFVWNQLEAIEGWVLFYSSSELGR